MKRRLSWKLGVVLLLAFAISGCGTYTKKDSDETETTEIQIDFVDAESFEAALNDSQDVVNKTVRFCVSEYKSNKKERSSYYAGEKLRFISEVKIDVDPGDYIIGCVTKKPSKLFTVWQIPFEVIDVEETEEATPSITPTSTPAVTPVATATSTPTAIPTLTPTAIPTAVPSPTPTLSPTPKPTSTPTPVPTATPIPVDEDDEEEEEEEEEFNYNPISASQISVSCLTDYSHIQSEWIYLGNDEGVTFTISTSVKGITWDDLFVYYDEEMITVDYEDSYESNGKTYFKFYAEGLEEGKFEIMIFTVYDLVTYGEDAKGYYFEVMKLDDYQGRVVYVTQYGEKYHYSEACAGNSCFPTTYYDAVGSAYEPCHKCADEDL